MVIARGWCKGKSGCLTPKLYFYEMETDVNVGGKTSWEILRGHRYH